MSRITASPKAKDHIARLKKEGSLGDIPGCMVGSRKRRHVNPENTDKGYIDGNYPEPHSRALPPTQRQLQSEANDDEAHASGAHLSKFADRLISKIWRESPEVIKRIRDKTAALAVAGNPNWNAPKDTSSPGHPTLSRREKEPYGFAVAEKPGGQIQHKPQVFADVYGHHLSEAEHEAIKLLQRAVELMGRARMISGRAYNGMPGGATHDDDRFGHLPLTAKEREHLEIAEAAWSELTSQTHEWAERLNAIILRYSQDGTGRIPHVAEIGARLTRYKARNEKSGSWTDQATAAGVVATKDALIRFLEALQAALERRAYYKLRRGIDLQAQLTDYALQQRRVRK